ncbi:MAG: CoA transferase [Proteobacteria bacterium TMED72]|nr:MAG: CoA transferase [Proteobacteria bacterium TMED72]
MPGPLEGIKVVDFSAVISGPLCSMILADQGADVIKVEAPGRPDLLRKEWYFRGGLTSMFANCNRGKRSVAIDLQSEEGIEAAYALCDQADVVLENFRPGVMERLKVGPEDLHARNPGLVYCRISGYGQTGPWSGKRAYDPVTQAVTGYVAIQNNPEAPIPDLVRNALVDKATAYSAAQAITAALLARERGQEGQTVALSLLDAGLAFFWPDGMMKNTMLGEGTREGPALYDRYRLTETRDGHIVMWAGLDNEWHAVFRCLGLPELCEDERFATGRARKDNGEALGALLYDEFRKWSTDEIIQRMEEEQVPGGPVLPLEAVPGNIQIQHNQTVYEVEHPTAGRMRQCRPAALFSRTQAEAGAIAPLFGEQTDEVLGEVGFTPDQISEMRKSGSIE